MFKPNTSYKKLKDTYLFNTIYRKTNEYLTANPDKKCCGWNFDMLLRDIMAI